MSEYYLTKGYQVSNDFWNYLTELSEKHPTFFLEDDFILEIMKNREHTGSFVDDEAFRVAVDDYEGLQYECFQYQHEIGLIKFQTHEIGDTTYIEEV